MDIIYLKARLSCATYQDYIWMKKGFETPISLILPTSQVKRGLHRPMRQLQTMKIETTTAMGSAGDCALASTLLKGPCL